MQIYIQFAFELIQWDFYLLYFQFYNFYLIFLYISYFFVKALFSHSFQECLSLLIETFI